MIARHFVRRALSLSFAASVVLACTTASPVRSVDAHAMNLEDQTVALYTQDSDAPRCSGVWVAQDKILTAAHCESSDGEGDLYYSTYAEHIGVSKRPALHSMALAKDDGKHDLALYKASLTDMPRHKTAILASRPPVVGAGLHFMGHPAGLAWSYRSGSVASYRETDFRDDKDGPWLQVSSPIYKGDSGGGAYSDMGELVGIASFMATKVPSTGFYVWAPTVSKFLGSP